MPSTPRDTESQLPAMQAHLLGRIEFEQAVQLQQRLIGPIGDGDDGQIVLLVCEHPQVITVGRGGSPGEVATDAGLVRNHQIEVHWVNRGGGCLVHCPGQLAIYPLVPLRWHGFSVGQYVARFQTGVVETLGELGIHAESPPGRHGIWGRTGQLAALGVAVRNWVTYYGVYLNVCPPLGLMRLVESDPIGQSDMSSLMAERCGLVKMTTVRATLIRRLAEAFGCDRYHLHTGHPLLRNRATSRQEA
jgi:lipoyl(octanoyl) transferase